MEAGQLWRQYAIGAIANIAIANTGYSMGWTAPITSKLQDPDQSPLGRPATSDEIAWIGSLVNIGAIFGPFLGGFAASKIGRKWALMSSIVPLLVGWIMTAVATSIAVLYAARIVWGLAIGMLTTISPMYCAEIATDDSRGALGSFLQAFMTIGFLLVYAIGPFISYHVVSYVGIAFVVFFAIAFFFMPESPTYYLLKGYLFQDDSRGALGSFLQAFMTIGFLLVYAIGPFISYHVVSYVGIAFVVFFAIAFFFMPESPTYYLLKDNKEGAAKCLEVIRGRSRAGVESELSQISADVAASMERTATIGELFRGSNFKAFYISCLLVFFQQFSGINAVLFYLTDIFTASGTTLDPDIATIIIGAVQVVGSFMTPFVVDRLGRRVLMLISSCGTAIGSGLLGMYFLLENNGSPVVDSIRFLPILSLVLFMITYSWGVGPLPWAIIGELFPVEVKSIASPIATAFIWMLSFLVTYFFPSISDSIGMHVGFFIFGGCSVVAFFFSLFVLPETKGKSFEEIRIMLGGGEKPEKA